MSLILRLILLDETKLYHANREGNLYYAIINVV